MTAHHKNSRIRVTLGAMLSFGLAATLFPQVASAAPPTAHITISPTTFDDNSTINVAVDFPTATYDGQVYGNSPNLSLYSNAGGTFEKVTGFSGKKSTSDGKYTFTGYNVGIATHAIKVCSDQPSPDASPAGSYYADPAKDPLCTAEQTINPTTPPAPGTAELTIQPDGKRATARFGTPHSGQSVSLQIQTIVTSMTTEVATAAWKTIATATQNSSGEATFNISNPYEVKHSYRAISGADSTDPLVAFAAPVTPKNTGIPQVFLNTNEQASINTRDRYFEGSFEFRNSATPNELGSCTFLQGTTNRLGQPMLAAAKGRGNYSWTFSKKSFTVKLDKKVNICGMGASKKWALIANHYDRSLLRNAAAYELGTKFTNLGWSPKTKPVDLFLNGAYHGSYLLVERIAIDPLRVNITGADDYSTVTDPDSIGYILEWDFRKGADYNVTAGSRGWVGIKEPEKDLDAAGNDTGKGITSGQRSFIDGYLGQADSALFGSGFKGVDGWRKYLDEASAVDYYLAMEYLKPVDGNMWASVFMYKPAGGKLKFGPLWDFDLGLGSANRAGNVVSSSGWYLKNVIDITAKQSTKTWFNRLNEDPAFRSAVRARYGVLKSQLDLNSWMDQQKRILGASAAANYQRWSHGERISSYQVIKSSWSADVSYLRSWLGARRTWVGNNV